MSIEIPVEVVALGIISGLTYGLLAVGLTLVYRTSRVLNFAHGALGALPATVLPVLTISVGLTYWLALPAALALGALGGCLLEAGVIRRLRGASRLVVMVATIAAAQLLGVLVIVLPGTDDILGRPFPTPFEADFSIGDLHLGAGELLILVVAPALALALSAFFHRTRLGLAASAAADNPQAALLTGIPVRQVSLAVWGIAGLFAASASILEAGTRPIAAVGATLGPALLIRGLTAAMLGGFKHLPRVFAAGVAIGVVEHVVRWNYPTGGLLNVVLLVVVIGSMLLHRDLGLAARGNPVGAWSLAGELGRLPTSIAGHPRVRAVRRGGLAVLIVGSALLAGLLSPSQSVLLSSVLIFAIIGLSFVVLAGYAGQVSLGQYALVMLGALVGGRMSQLGFPSGSALAYAIGGCAVVAGVIGLPALRVRGLFLAVVTLAFALAADGWLFQQEWLVRSSFQADTSMVIDRPEWLGVDFADETRFAWLCLAVLVAVGAAVHRLRQTGVGRSLVAVRDNELSAASMSVSPRRMKLQAFMVSGAIAGLAGYLYGALLVNFTAALGGAELSISLLVMAVLGGITTVTGAVLGALWVQGIPYAFGTNVGLFSSAVGVLVVLIFLPNGLAGVAFRLRDRAASALAGGTAAEASGPITRPRLPARVTGDEASSIEPVLECHDLSVRFGGNVAVDRVSISVQPGEVVGLLGPNGAGKSTLIDLLSGHERPSEGVVHLRGSDVTWLPPEQRAQLGLGRTFQQARLFDGLTVREAIQVGLERDAPSELVPSLFGLPPSRRAERAKRIRADELLEMVGLSRYASMQTAELSTGMRRMAELACVIAVGADVILLDEPTAGIAQVEVEQFTPVLRELRDHLDATIVIVEHDIPLLMSLADRLYVLAAGQVIASGPPEAVRADPAVVAAYLGADPRTIERSGRAPVPTDRPPRRRTATPRPARTSP